MLNILLIIAGFALLVYGANFLVDGASALAKKLNVPNIVIGLTIVAFGTSSPELSVNVIAAIKHESAITLGNIIGSNIFNVLLILGITSLINPLHVKTNTTWVEIPLAVLSALVVFVLANDILFDHTQQSIISRTDGIVLVFFFIIFLAYNFHLVKSGKTDETFDTKDFTVLKSLGFILLGLVMLIAGGKIIVVNASGLARTIGLSERVIALTIVSIGTSLPELATSVIAVRKKNVDMAIGNVVGSNIFNAFCILGISAVIHPISIGAGVQVDLITNILAGILLFAFIFTGKGRRVEAWEGIIFLLVYFTYMIYIIM